MSRIAFIGAGRMASAIVRGLVGGGEYRPDEIACSCGDDPTGPELAATTGIRYTADIGDQLTPDGCLVLACKPQQFDSLPASLGDAAKGMLVLSILAGTRLARLAEAFPAARNIVRTMPNTPGQIGAGVSAYAPLRELSAGDRRTVETVLGALGSHHRVEESDLDAVTAVSGSGPAYVFEFAAALREAAVSAGLDPQLAAALATDTVLGAAKLLARPDADPEALRDAVTSKGGTTAAALAVFSERGFRDLVRDAVAAAKERSVELGK